MDKNIAKYEFLEYYHENIDRPGSEDLYDFLVNKSNFFEDPASTKYHLAEPGGLVRHSVNVYRRLAQLNDIESRCNPKFKRFSLETIAIVGLLHDLCKVNTYKSQDKYVKNYDHDAVYAAPKDQVKSDAGGKFIWDKKTEYVKDDHLLMGHGEKSVYLISQFMKLTDMEAQAIRYHMGPWNDWEKNDASKVFETNWLAFILHTADEFATFVDEV